MRSTARGAGAVFSHTKKELSAEEPLLSLKKVVS
jgi:hypothetical protein